MIHETIHAAREYNEIYAVAPWPADLPAQAVKCPERSICQKNLPLHITSDCRKAANCLFKGQE